MIIHYFAQICFISYPFSEISQCDNFLKLNLRNQCVNLKGKQERERCNGISQTLIWDSSWSLLLKSYVKTIQTLIRYDMDCTTALG